MAYDRYDTRQGPRDRSSRWSEDRFENRGSHDRNERGWLERAGDQIASWFGDEDDRGDRSHDREFRSQRGRDWDRGQDSDRGQSFGRRDDEDRGRFWRERSWDRDDFERDDRFQSSDRGTFRRDFDPERGRGRQDYRPMTGDYSRSEQFYAASGTPRGGFGRGRTGRGEFERGQFDRDIDDRSQDQRSQTPWGRDEYRRTSLAGSADRGGEFDPHYRTWRDRQVQSLDRDYDEYRQERQSRFEDDFSGWRQQRQSKREMLQQVREHMEVVGNDDKHVGTIDRVAGDRLILTKSDPEAGGVHHSLSCSDIERIDGERVILNCSSTEARVRWRDESRGRALFEREDQGRAGPHVLDRSFEGTYR